MYNTLRVCKYWYQIELLVLDSSTWNYLTMCKEMGSGLFKMLSCSERFSLN